MDTLSGPTAEAALLRSKSISLLQKKPLTTGTSVAELYLKKRKRQTSVTTRQPTFYTLKEVEKASIVLYGDTELDHCCLAENRLNNT